MKKSTRRLRVKTTGSGSTYRPVKTDPLPEYLQNIDLRKTDASWSDINSAYDNLFKGDLKGIDDRHRQFLIQLSRATLAVLDGDKPDLEACDRAIAEVSRLWREWDDALILEERKLAAVF